MALKVVFLLAVAITAASCSPLPKTTDLAFGRREPGDELVVEERIAEVSKGNAGITKAILVQGRIITKVEILDETPMTKQVAKIEVVNGPGFNNVIITFTDVHHTGIYYNVKVYCKKEDSKPKNTMGFFQ